MPQAPCHMCSIDFGKLLPGRRLAECVTGSTRHISAPYLGARIWSSRRMASTSSGRGTAASKTRCRERNRVANAPRHVALELLRGGNEANYSRRKKHEFNNIQT